VSVSSVVLQYSERLLGRLPIGWLQLFHNKVRLVAALAGVAFANVLVFMQLGFLGALVSSVALPYESMNADLIVSASDMNSLGDGSPIPRARMYEALGVEGVESATPVQYGKLAWKKPDGSEVTLDVFGIDPSGKAFSNADIEAQKVNLAMSDVAIIDRKTRNVPPDIIKRIGEGTPFQFESRGKTLTVVGTFTIGGGFSADGYLLVSDQTFLRMFPNRISGAPNYVFVKVKPGVSVAATQARLSAILSAADVSVRTKQETIEREQYFQTTQKPVGIIFYFGVVIGIIVCGIIVYQVLTTDVADHLKEYATFKAIGYTQRFFVSIVLEEAVILALLGFVPALLISVGFYAVVSSATGLPVAMTASRAGGVLLGTFLMSTFSGVLATRRLARANPAELFA
jgi:putative ABC transport system permease protein